MIFNINDIAVSSNEHKKLIARNKVDNIEVTEKTVMNRSIKIEHDSFFTSEKFKRGLVFFDFEVFEYDWLVVLIDPMEDVKTIIANDKSALNNFFRNNCHKIWVGYNNKHYDNYILKGILLGMNPKKISDFIIRDRKQGYEFSDEFRKIKLLSYDIMIQINNAPSLKVYEAFMGNDIEETDVPFDIQRMLSLREIHQTVKYCIHDVEQTIEVFKFKIDDFNGITMIVEMFDFSFEWILKTKGQLTALVTDCHKKPHNDEFNVRILDCIKLNRYAYIKDWFMAMCKNKTYTEFLPDTGSYSEILKHGTQVINKGKRGEDEGKVAFKSYVCGIPHLFAWGGAHGASESPVHIVGKMFHLDVTSFYPSLMIVYGMFTRNADKPEKFKYVYDTRVALKNAGKKKEQAPLKIILNSQFGITKAPVSEAFDPVQANNICLNGQLMLMDLLEHLEDSLGDRLELIQSNTDGIIIKIDEDPKTERIMKHICQEWCIRTGMGLGMDERLIRYMAKDVNNYIFEFYDYKYDEKMDALFAYLKQFSSNMEMSDKTTDEYAVVEICKHIIIHDMNADIQSAIKSYEKENKCRIAQNGNKIRLLGKMERKGAYIKELNDLDNDMPIVNEAVTNYMIYGTKPEDTVNDCDDFMKFQIIFKVSKKYAFASHNNIRYDEHTFRVFASTDVSDGPLYKYKEEDSEPGKFANSPEHCFIYNKSVKGKNPPIKLDKKWYINTAKKRLEDYGFFFKSKNQLF